MNRKLMTEKELMDWVDTNLELGSGERGETYVTAKDLRELFAGMMLVPTKEALLPLAKDVYPIAQCSRISGDQARILRETHCAEVNSSRMGNDHLLWFIRQFEPDYPDMHTEKK